jgi:TnpA family transposase
MTEWRSRYRGYGVLVYWHIETNVEKNSVESHGQSEVAFALCHLLGGVRLMPRLKGFSARLLPFLRSSRARGTGTVSGRTWLRSDGSTSMMVQGPIGTSMSWPQTLP